MAVLEVRRDMGGYRQLQEEYGAMYDASLMKAFGRINYLDSGTKMVLKNHADRKIGENKSGKDNRIKEK